jgi:predicted dehydrogenase
VSEIQTVRIGIIGAGKIANVHAKYYKQTPGVELVGVADIVPGKAAAYAAEWGIPAANVFTDYRDLLEKVDLDAVSVCTFNQAHRDPAIDALGAGKHVLLEKPMAASLADAQDIMRAWQSSDRIMMVSFQPDFSTEHRAAKQIVEAGTLGRIYYAETVAHRRWGIPGGTFMKRSSAGFGTLVDIGVYALHTALWLMGDPKPVSVSAMTADYLAKGFAGVGSGWGGQWNRDDVEVEEFASAYVRFDNGATLVFKTAWASNLDSMGRTFFLGTQGGMALDPLEIYVNQQIAGLNMTATPKGLKPVDDWAEKMRAFVEAVRAGGPSPIDPRGVYLTNVIMDGIARSAELGYEVKVDCSY